mmetsp:Transcript_127561/g.397196  ORF Transcript_127561/g.397196 Transcript_127561/m.397196 type:complete len:200 (-) Transcript_127561:1585-2184(-)
MDRSRKAAAISRGDDRQKLRLERPTRLRASCSAHGILGWRHAQPQCCHTLGIPNKGAYIGCRLSPHNRPAQSLFLQWSSRLRLEARPGAQAAAVRLEPLLQASGGRQHEAEEEGPRLGRAARELGVELARQEEGVAPQLAQLHALAAVVLAGEVQAPLLHGRHASRGDLVAVPVALIDYGPTAVEPARQGLGVPDDRCA